MNILCAIVFSFKEKIKPGFWSPRLPTNPMAGMVQSLISFPMAIWVSRFLSISSSPPRLKLRFLSLRGGFVVEISRFHDLFGVRFLGFVLMFVDKSMIGFFLLFVSFSFPIWKRMMEVFYGMWWSFPQMIDGEYTVHFSLSPQIGGGRFKPAVLISFLPSSIFLFLVLLISDALLPLMIHQWSRRDDEPFPRWSTMNTLCAIVFSLTEKIKPGLWSPRLLIHSTSDNLQFYVCVENI